MMIAALACAGTPGPSGFFSKESIVEAAHLSHVPGAGFAYFCVLSTVFVTAFYVFRLMFMTFYGPERWRNPPVDDKRGEHGHGEHALSEHAQGDHAAHDHEVHEPHETPWVVTLPLILLAI